MPYEPESIIGEILGKTASKAIDPSTENYICPFIRSKCVKRSQKLGLVPYPVCSIWVGVKNPELICVCPKRFYAVKFLRDVVDHCWPGEHPKSPHIAPEVKMRGFGNVDFVIADVGKGGAIEQFLSVELQAIDITGSVMPAYEALLSGNDLNKKPTYGLNWQNVYKRFITQLIAKGYFHHHWKTKIVAVIQDQVYQYIVEHADFMRSPDVKGPAANIIFMTYRLEIDPEIPGQFKPVLTRVEGTSHADLQTAIMYKEAPAREEFCSQIQKSLSRFNDQGKLSL